MSWYSGTCSWHQLTMWCDADQLAQVDDVGNAWVAGDTLSSLDGHTNAGSVDIFLMKFDAQGVHLWTRQRGGSGFDYAKALKADGVRRCFSCDILWHFPRRKNFRSSCESRGVASPLKWINLLCAFTRFDISYLVKCLMEVWAMNFDSIDRAGSCLECLELGTHKSARWWVLYDVQVSARALSSEKRSDIFETTLYGSWFEFLGFILTQWGMQFFIVFAFAMIWRYHWSSLHIFPVWWASPSVFLWISSRICGALQSSTIFAQVDDVGNAWVAGATRSSLDGHTNAGVYDIFLMKFDAQGVHLWTRQRGGEDNDYAEALQADGVRLRFRIFSMEEKHGKTLDPLARSMFPVM